MAGVYSGRAEGVREQRVVVVEVPRDVSLGARGCGFRDEGAAGPEDRDLLHPPAWFGSATRRAGKPRELATCSSNSSGDIGSGSLPARP